MDELLGYQIRRASAAILTDLGAILSDLGLRITEASLLLVLRKRPGLTQSEIGRILGIQRANMNPLAGGLVERGLIVRIPADGRSHGLNLTPAGDRLAAEVKLRTDAFEAQLLPDLTEAQRAWLIEMLGRIWK